MREVAKWDEPRGWRPEKSRHRKEKGVRRAVVTRKLAVDTFPAAPAGRPARNEDIG